MERQQQQYLMKSKEAFMTEEEKVNVMRYLSQLSVMEQQAIQIAHSELGTSFNIIKSNGYKSFMSMSK